MGEVDRQCKIFAFFKSNGYILHLICYMIESQCSLAMTAYKITSSNSWDDDVSYRILTMLEAVQKSDGNVIEKGVAVIKFSRSKSIIKTFCRICVKR